MDQDTPASQFKEPGLKRKVSIENKLLSRMKRQKWDDDYYVWIFFIPEVNNRATSRLLNACFAILNIVTSV